jgi:iron complex outermembrane receptor protein
MRSNKAYIVSLLLSSALTAVLAGPAMAAPSDKDNAQQEVVVTGSALPTTLDAVAVPVSTINAQSINRSGVTTNVLEILRKDLPSFSGRSNVGSSNANNTNQNTAGGSQLELRNLDTLTLIDGRRSAINAVAGLGGKNFVDVNQIPAAAIDRIEVLADGSSAIYGSDAVGGVVNLILKHNFTGEEVGLRYGGASGGYNEKSAYLIAGGNPIEGVNLTLIADYSSNNPLSQSARPFSSPFYVVTSSVPGVMTSGGTPYILSAALNSPRFATPTGPGAAVATSPAMLPGIYSPSDSTSIGRTFDESRFQTLLLRQEQKALAGNFTANLSPSGHLQAFGGVEYSENTSSTQFLPIRTSVTVPSTSPYDPLSVNATGVVFGDTLAPKRYHNDSTSFRATFGLRGDFHLFDRDWKWEGAVVHSQDDLTQLQKNLIFKANLPLAIAGGFDSTGAAVVGGKYSKVHSNFDPLGALVLQPALDPFATAGGIIPGSLDNVIGVETLTAKSVLDSGDLKLTGSPFTLPGGDVGLALGGGWRRESLSASTDPNGTNTIGAGAQQWIGGQFNDPFAKSRTISSVFAELRVPITGPNFNAPGLHALDFIGAVRAEHYSDAGDAVVPKFGFRWQPLDGQLTVRGTFSKSFTAPSLFAEYGPTDTRIAGGAIIGPQAFPAAGFPSMPFQAEDGNNPHLQPAKGDTYSLGVVIKPDAIPGLKVTADYSKVIEHGIAGGIGFANILIDVNNKGSASQFYNNISSGNFVGLAGASQFSAPGALLTYLTANGTTVGQQAAANNLYAIDRFTNLGGVQVTSFNVNVDYVMNTDHWGTFTFDSTAAIFASYKYQALASQSYYEYAGTSTNGGTGVQGTLPKYRVYSSIDWAFEDTDVTLGNTWISSVQDLGAGGLTYATNHALHPTTVFPLTVAAYTAWDIRVQHKFTLGGGFVKLVTVAGGVNNIFDAMPPLSPNAFTDNHADAATYSPIGRMVYVSATAKF